MCIRDSGVTAAQLAGGGAPVQGALFAAPVKKRDRLLKAMDAIRDRHGEDSVRHGGERRRTNPWGPDDEG